MKVDKFTIDRGKWLTGRDVNNGHDSLLYNEELGKKCCIGHYLTACGVKDLKPS